MLTIFGYALFGIIALKTKDELLMRILSGLNLFLIYYATLGQSLDDLITLGIFIILIIIVIIYNIIKKRISRIHLTLRPIATILLFVISLVLHKILTTYGMPWFTGYILVTISFIIGLILYRKEISFKKKSDNDQEKEGVK